MRLLSAIVRIDHSTASCVLKRPASELSREALFKRVIVPAPASTELLHFDYRHGEVIFRATDLCRVFVDGFGDCLNDFVCAAAA